MSNKNVKQKPTKVQSAEMLRELNRKLRVYRYQFMARKKCKVIYKNGG
jgi:uncharacterized protein YllA (UPF0747 family)